MRKTQRLRELLASDGIVMAGGAHDAFSARLVEQAGFELCVVTGAGVAACRGYPDVGLVTLEEMTRNARYIADALTIPVIIDADNGYGNAINVVRTVKEFEHAGVSGIHLEDQVWPKRCGHMFGKTLIPKEEMCQKLKAALDAREDPDFVIIARCDAMLVNGLDDVIDRCDAYIEAGADMLFCEVREDMDEIKSSGKIKNVQELPLLSRGVPNGLDVETDNDVKSSWAIRHGNPRDPIRWATTLADGAFELPSVGKQIRVNLCRFHQANQSIPTWMTQVSMSIAH